MHLISTLGPIILVTALGFALFRTGFFPRTSLPALNQACYWVGLPALLFHSVATVRTGAASAPAMVSVLLLATAVALAVGYLLARTLRLPRTSHGTFVQAGFRGNLAYIGLPIILYSLAPGSPVEQIRGVVIVAMAPVIIVYNALAVAVLLASQANRGPNLLGRVVVSALRNPLLVATALGGVWSYLSLPLPLVFDRTLGALGQLALPLALVCVGGSLATVSLGGQRTAACAAALLKVAVTPALGALLLPLFGVTGPEARAVLVLLACPSAVAGYTMAVQLGGDEALASSSVVLSTLLALPALAVVLMLT